MRPDNILEVSRLPNGTPRKAKIFLKKLAFTGSEVPRKKSEFLLERTTSLRMLMAYMVKRRVTKYSKRLVWHLHSPMSAIKFKSLLGTSQQVPKVLQKLS